MIPHDTLRLIDSVSVSASPSSSSFLSQFFPNLAATFAGVILGIVGALIVDRRLTQSKRGAGRRALLEAYRHAVAENRELCHQLLQHLTPTRVVFYSLNVGLFDALAEKALDVMDDLPFLQRLNGFHFQLGHLNRKLDRYVEHSFSPTPDRANWGDLRHQLVETIHNHAGVLRTNAEELLRDLDERLAKARPPDWP